MEEKELIKIFEKLVEDCNRFSEGTQYAQDLQVLSKARKALKKVKKNGVLHSVSHSYYQVVFDGKNDDMQEVTAGLKTIEEAKQALEENKKHFDEPMYIIAKINCG